MSPFYNSDGTDISADVAAFTLEASIFALLRSPLDAKLCNYYQLLDKMVIESIPEYLGRVYGGYRSAGAPVAILYPKEGTVIASPYSFGEFATALRGFETRFYTFMGGLEDADFKEITAFVKTRNSVIGRGSVDEPIELVNDEEEPGSKKYYGTDENGEKGYHPFEDTHPPVTIAEDSLDKGSIGEDQKLHLLWPNIKQEVVNTVDFRDGVRDLMKNCKRGYIQENVLSTYTTQMTEWKVVDINELFGIFKATITIRDKVTDTVVNLHNVYGFDKQGNFASLDTEVITDPTINLELFIDGNNLLGATITNMSSNDKRIFFCFERCCIDTIIKRIYGTSTDTCTASGTLGAHNFIQGTSTDTCTAEGKLSAKGLMKGESTDTCTAEGRMIARWPNVTMWGSSTDTCTVTGTLTGKYTLTVINGTAVMPLVGESTDTCTVEGKLISKIGVFGIINTLSQVQGIMQNKIIPINYGTLFNMYAANDARNIAPTGWHVPTNAEWQTLFDYIASVKSVSWFYGGQFLKEMGTTHWDSPNTGATNEFGFNGVGGGTRGEDGVFSVFRAQGNYMSSNIDQVGGTDRSGIRLSYNSALASFTYSTVATLGKSLRLLKDDSTLVESLIGNDGTTYPCVKIGNQVWMAKNSRETKYRNGDLIPEVTSDAAWAALLTGARCAYNNDINNI